MAPARAQSHQGGAGQPRTRNSFWGAERASVVLVGAGELRFGGTGRDPQPNEGALEHGERGRKTLAKEEVEL